jgi:hypothetical protein
MPRPHLGEISYLAYCQYLDGPQPDWETLPLTVKLAWGMAARAAILEAHRLPCSLDVQVAKQKAPASRGKNRSRCLPLP